MGKLDYEMEKAVYSELAIAIVRQAIDDWRDLCKGKEPNGHCNFGELTRFFKDNCDGYLDNTDIDAKRIYALLRQERSRAESKGVAG